MSAVLLTIIMFVKVFLMGFQSKNVVGNHYRTAFGTSLVMGLLEVAIITEVVSHGWWSAVPISVGGSLGIVCSMWLHTLIFPKPRSCPEAEQAGTFPEAPEQATTPYE